MRVNSDFRSSTCPCNHGSDPEIITVIFSLFLLIQKFKSIHFLCHFKKILRPEWRYTYASKLIKKPYTSALKNYNVIFCVILSSVPVKFSLSHCSIQQVEKRSKSSKPRPGDFLTSLDILVGY